MVECFNTLEALVESLGTLMGSAGAAETELTMREEHFKVGAESDGRKVECFWKDKHQPSQTKNVKSESQIKTSHFCEEKTKGL